MTFSHLIEPCKDGTIKYRNPFSGTQCWYTPGRKHRPIHTDCERESQPIHPQHPPGYCSFCPAHYWETTPEKSRLLYNDGMWEFQDQPTPEDIFSNVAHVRRIGNLYEIISIDYWRENYGFNLSPKHQQFKEQYLSSAMGREHVLYLIDSKLKHFGATAKEVKALAPEMKIRVADSFFGGAHELVIPWRHYRPGARNDSELFSTGEMTPEEHFNYFKLAIHSISEIYQNNPFVKFVSTYTNWKRDAGASFEHLHRQIIGLDLWGDSLQRGISMARVDANVFADYVHFIAKQQQLVICENDHAVAFADIGQPFSTVAIFSRSNKAPHHLPDDTIRGVSDIVHALHAALGSQEACNEEWYYTPQDADVDIPWYILLKWRKNRHAGIEGSTRLYVDVFRPEDIRDLMIDRLKQQQRDGHIAALNIGQF